MGEVKKVLFVLAVVSVCMVGFANTSTAANFGVPDPTPGAMLMGWFDIGAEPGDTDNVLPVFVNMSSELLGLPGDGSPYRVHLIFWDVNSNHVWDKNLRLSPWDVWSDASVRDIIENTIGDGMAAPQREKVTKTVTIDGVEVKRYRGYWTATAVTRSVGTSKPYQINYPHLYSNILGGWVYVVDLLDGRADGYPMVAVEADFLYANSMETAFMLSFSGDFWNRPWWWVGTTYLLGNNTGNVSGPYYSLLWDCAQDEPFAKSTETETSIIVELGGVYERFDATSCLNASLLSSGKAVTSDDTWLARSPSCAELPYDGGESFLDENRGGMMLFGRFFRKPVEGAVSDFTNRLVLWFDTNSGERRVVLVVCDEDEGCHSFPLIVPDELVIHRLDEVVADVLTGFVYFHTRQIESPGAKQRMLAYWRTVADPVAANPAASLYACTGNTITTFLPINVTCTLEGAENTAPFGNALQILGWTTTEGLGTSEESWGAIFPMIRKCILGDPATLGSLDAAAAPPLFPELVIPVGELDE